jgi:uncharacterized protein with von Willebrand factor type A (vWA) domain
MRQQYPSIERFALFGKMGVQQDRELIARYLQGMVEGKSAQLTGKVFPPHLKPYRKLIDELLLTPGLYNMLLEHPALRDNVAEDILQFIEGMGRQAELKEAQMKQKGGSASKAGKKAARWARKFFRSLMKAMQKASGWSGFSLTTAKERMKSKMQMKVQRFDDLKKMLAPFMTSAEMWGSGEGVWKKADFELLKHYEEILDKKKDLQEMADMLGRYRAAETEYEKEILQNVKLTPYKKIYRHGKEELVGLHESDELSSMLPSEASLLGSEDTETLFYKKYIEKKLQTFELQSTAKEKKTEKNPEEKIKEKPKDQGPVIICIDTSASMLGKPEQAAKVLAFAILKVALKTKRPCFLISFSKTIQTIELSNLSNSLESLIGFLSMSFLGGTDASPAIEEAVNHCYEEVYRNADVLMISDGKLPEFSEQLNARMYLAQTKGNRFFSLTIGTDAKKELFKAFNEAWAYHPNQTDSIKQIIAGLKELEKRS